MGGGGSTYDYGFRIYNPQIAKFLSVDPLSPDYPELTPYQYASNRPIDGIDLDGLEWYKDAWEATKSGYNTTVKTVSANYTTTVANTVQTYDKAVKTVDRAVNYAKNTNLNIKVEGKVSTGLQVGAYGKIPVVGKYGVVAKGVSHELINGEAGFNVNKKGVDPYAKGDLGGTTNSGITAAMTVGGTLEHNYETNKTTVAAEAFGVEVQDEIDNNKDEDNFSLKTSVGAGLYVIFGAEVNIEVELTNTNSETSNK